MPVLVPVLVSVLVLVLVLLLLRPVNIENRLGAPRLYGVRRLNHIAGSPAVFSALHNRTSPSRSLAF